MTQEQQNFIESIYNCLVKHAPNYNIKCYPPIIAQAILESGWGKSKLAKDYHNYFGLKCGNNYNGKSVNMKTFEEYEIGVITQIKDNFRVYDNMECGVIGYLEFLNYSRYNNLHGVTDTNTYIYLLKQDGYATSNDYISSLMTLVTMYDLEKYSCVTSTNNYKSVYEIADEVIAGKWGNGNDRKNKLSCVGYDYNEVQQIVNEKCNSNKKPNDVIAKEVIKGLWGNGEDRKNKLIKAGYDYNVIQKIVNSLV